MDIFLWILQWLLAAVFLMSGAVKAFMPPAKLLENERMGWITDTGIQQARMAGFAEILAAFGLVLPGLTSIPDFFTPLAALGLVVVMGLATITVHKPRNEPLVPTMVLGALALIVAVGRVIQPMGG